MRIGVAHTTTIGYAPQNDDRTCAELPRDNPRPHGWFAGGPGPLTSESAPYRPNVFENSSKSTMVACPTARGAILPGELAQEPLQWLHGPRQDA